MPQKSNFDLNSETLGVVFPTVGILMSAKSDSQESEQVAFLGAYYDTDEKSKGLYIVLPSSEIKYFDIDIVNVKPQNGGNQIIRFDHKGISYLMRTVYGDDGSWLSNYKIDVPQEVLERKIMGESTPALKKYLDPEITEPLPFFESLSAYYADGQETITFLNYMSSYGTFSRLNAEWQPVDVDMEIYETLFVVEIDSKSSTELLQKFDDQQGILSVKDVEAVSAVSPTAE